MSASQAAREQQVAPRRLHDLAQPRERSSASLQRARRRRGFRPGHARFEAPVERPQRRQLAFGLPEAGAEAGERGRAERRRFRVRRAQHGNAEQVRLELQQQVVARRAAVDAQLRQRMAGVLAHGVDEIGGLERDALQCRAGDVRAVGAAREPDEGAARRGVPLGRAEPGKRGHQIDIARVRNAGGQRFDFVGTADHAETVAQPLHRGATHEHAALERELAAAAAPGDGGEQSMTGPARRRACVHERETTGAIGVLRHAGLEAGLAEQRRLLVARDARERQFGAVEVELDRRTGRQAGVDDLRQCGARNPEQFAAASRSSRRFRGRTTSCGSHWSHPSRAAGRR